MLPIKSRKPFTPLPYRQKGPASPKIIFLSLEGLVTEEEYFGQISALYDCIASKIQFISVSGEAVNTPPKLRTPTQESELSRVRPRQLVDRIDRFKEKNQDKFQFDQYPEDEFWIVCDVDKNWSNDLISSNLPKTYLQEWNEATEICRLKNYSCAISHPFFEIWLRRLNITLLRMIIPMNGLNILEIG